MATESTKFYILQGREENKNFYYGRVRPFINHKFKNPKFNIDYKYDCDVKAIRESFEKLNFKVDDPILNKTAEEMIACFKNKRINYFGCAVIIVFSHGEEDYIYGTDYDEEKGTGKINVSHDLYDKFSGASQPEMQTWPKLFFNEWCQLPGSLKPPNKKQKRGTGFHNTAHWLIYDAAMAGYETFVHEDEGSCSIQAFCQRLNEFAQTKDVQEILELVIGDVSKQKIEQEDGSIIFMQPIQHSTLHKKLYLLPEDKVYELLSTYRKEFEHLSVIDSGGSSVVLRAQNVFDKGEYAVKRIQLKNNTECDLKKIEKEIESLAQFNQCLQIVGYQRRWLECQPFDYQSKQDSKHKINGLIQTGPDIHLCYIQMTLCGKSLEKWLKENRQRDKNKALKIFEQIVQGLAFIHKKGKVHLDIKPSNILFLDNDSDDCICLADFGLARNVDSYTMTNVAGTLLYMAPEILRKKFDSKSDMYSAGLILLELLYDCSEQHEEILSDAKSLKFPAEFQNDLKFALPTLEKLLSDNLVDRPSSVELIDKWDTLWKNEELESSASSPESIYRNEFDQRDILGCGGFGVVFKAVNVNDGRECAVKRIQLRENSEFEQRNFKRKIESLSKFVQCAQVVNYQRVWYECADFNCQFEEDRKSEIYRLSKSGPNIHFIYVQMDLFQESLENWLKNRRGHNTVESLGIFKQILQGLVHIHKLDLVHQDIKPSNILFYKNVIRISDFEFAVHRSNFTTNAGTLLYTAPEVMNQKVDPKSDIYSAGLILIELLFNCSEDQEKILNDAKGFHFPEPFRNAQKFAVTTLEKVLSIDLNVRPSSDEFLKIVCTDPDWNEDWKLYTTASPAKNDWHFISTCTKDQHSFEDFGQWTVSDILSWNGETGESEWFSLSAETNTNTRWEVQFMRWSDNDFGVYVRCSSLDAQFHAASFRMFAAVDEGDSHVWLEAAAILEPHVKSWFSPFSEKFRDKSNDCPGPVIVRVCIWWTELDLLPPEVDLWKDGATSIECSWEMAGWKAVTPTSDSWKLFSNLFERSGAYWRIEIVYLQRKNWKRRLQIRVWLEHLTCDLSGMSWNCVLFAWNKQEPEQSKNMVTHQGCSWIIVDDVKSKLRNLSDVISLKVYIEVSRKIDNSEAT